ncbi:MAG: hypothetical protein AAGK38_04665 [Pseudomonadota bacterium]
MAERRNAVHMGAKANAAAPHMGLAPKDALSLKPKNRDTFIPFAASSIAQMRHILTFT